MKKNVKSAISLTALLAMLIFGMAGSYGYPVPPVNDNYRVDSLKIIPLTAYTGVSLNLVAYTTHTSGGCQLISYRIWKSGKFIVIDATYEQGPLDYICHSADTIALGTYPPGNYFLLYDWMDTISFKVLPNQQGCQAYYTYTYPKCNDAKCLNTVAFMDSSKGSVIKWLWDFGDSKYAEEQNPVHTYGKPGVYDVCLKIVTEDGCSGTYCELVPVGVSEECRAYFETVYPDCYTSNVVDCYSNYVAFINRSSGNVIKWMWDFGDGQTSDEKNPLHYYMKTGRYEVCLTIETSAGCTDTYCDTVYVSIAGCKADFRWEPLRCTDEIARCYGMYQFIDMSFSRVISWKWDFGDGTSSDSQNPVHGYINDGIYPVSLTIETSYGCTDTKYDTLVVGDTIPAKCKARFRWQPLICFESILPCPRSFSFIDLSGGDPIKWYWNFGDGDTSTMQNPVHTYKCNGRYQVSLTIFTASGCSDIRLDTITVGDSLVPCCNADYKWEEVYPNFDCLKKTTDCITPYYFIQFTDISTGKIIGWHWDFGDGTGSDEQNLVHEYKFAGKYEVCLTINCGGWCFDNICKTILVGDTIPGPCDADFTVDPQSPPCACPACYCVNFVDQSSWNAVEWLWDFGDGDTSTLKNPFHVYNLTQGDTLYKVCLRIKTSDNCIDSICRLFDVMSGKLISGTDDTKQSAEQLMVFPNPVSSELYIRLSPELLNKFFEVSITDIFGRQAGLYRYEGDETADGNISIDVANLNNGQYICTVVTDKKTYKSRFVKTE